MTTQSLDAAATGFDARHFRNVLSQFATGVTVITTRRADGSFCGLTVSSFNSVSLDPPLVLWSLARKARSFPAFITSPRYVIHVLSSDQTALAKRFSASIDDRFRGVCFDLSPAGLPIINNVTAWFECQNRNQYAEGDHVIFIGQVERCDMSPQSALVFHEGSFISTNSQATEVCDTGF